MKEKWVEIFTKYVNNFDINDDAIKRKYEHSLRVMEISEFIARVLRICTKIY